MGSGKAESKISTYNVKDYNRRKEAKITEFTMENDPLPHSLHHYKFVLLENFYFNKIRNSHNYILSD